MLIIGIALLGTVIGSSLRDSSLKCSSVSRYLGMSTSYLSRGQHNVDSVFALESSPLSSFYVGRVAGTVRASSTTYIIFIRAVLLCCPLFLF